MLRIRVATLNSLPHCGRTKELDFRQGAGERGGGGGGGGVIDGKLSATIHTYGHQAMTVMHFTCTYATRIQKYY